MRRSSCAMVILLLGMLSVPSPALAGEVRLGELNPFSGLGDSALGTFSGWNAALHLTAAGGTLALVESGADTHLHNYFVERTAWGPYTVPGIYGGYFLPLTAGSALFGAGLAADSPDVYLASCAILQSTLLAFSYQTVLKTFTGRRAPGKVSYDDDEASKEFRFGFMRGGIDWGWPSGLLMSNVAVVTSLYELFPESRPLQVGGGLWVGYLLFSTAAHETASLGWFSDVLAGTLMGVAIGRSVGQTFAARRDQGTSPDGPRLSLAPLNVDGAHGLAVEGQF